MSYKPTRNLAFSAKGQSKGCHICGKPMVTLCDATREDGKACNLPMCKEHSHHVGEDIDVCNYHNYPTYIKEAIEKREVQLYFEERYKEANFRVVPGHWPEFKTKKDVDHWINDMEQLSSLLNFKKEKSKLI